jgi:hypothetical protein
MVVGDLQHTVDHRDDAVEQTDAQRNAHRENKHRPQSVDDVRRVGEQSGEIKGERHFKYSFLLVLSLVSRIEPVAKEDRPEQEEHRGDEPNDQECEPPLNQRSERSP